MEREIQEMLDRSFEAAEAMADKLLQKPDLIMKGARVMKMYIDALIKEGFSKEEAIQLISHSNSMFSVNAK